jgi:hypothetical protein
MGSEEATINWSICMKMLSLVLMDKNESLATTILRCGKRVGFLKPR